MKVITSFISLFLICLVSPIISQDTCEEVEPIVLNVKIDPDPASAPNVFPGDEFCLSICVENFVRVETFQINVGFDPELITLDTLPVSFENPSVSPNLAGLAIVNANTQDADMGILPLIYESTEFDPITLETFPTTLNDGDEVIRICFEAEDFPGQSSDVDALPPSAISFGTFETFAVVMLDDGTQCPDIPIVFNPTGTTVDIGCETISIVDLNICHSSGTISFSSCGGTFPVDYSLEGSGGVIETGTLQDESEIATITGLAPSPFYNLVLIDADGNRVERIIEILNNINPIQLNPVLVDPLCADRGNGSISFNITGGEGGNGGDDYNVQFSNGINIMGASGSISNLPNGSYSVIVRDESGCVEEFNGLDLFTPPIVIENVSIDSFRCLFSPNGCISLSASGGTPINGNEYNFNDLTTGSSFMQCDPMNANGGFDFMEQDTCYQVTVEDVNGCQLIECFRLPIRNRLQFEFDTIAPACNELGYTSTVTSLSNDRFLFSLSGPNGFVLTFGNNSFQIADTLQPGDYTWVITELGVPQAEACMESIDFTIPDFSVNPIMVMTSGTQPTCGEENGEARLDVTGGTGTYTYTWEFDPSIDQPVLTNIPAGMYNVTITDSSGCSTEEVVDLEQGVFLTIEADIIQDLDCTDPTVSAELEVMFVGFDLNELAFNWFTESESNLGDTPTLVTDTAGVYIIEVSTLTGTCTLTDTITVAEPTTITFEPLTIDPALCDPTNPQPGTIEINNIAGGSGIYICVWELDGIPLPPVTNIDCRRDDLGPGEYTITIVDNVTGCRTTEEIILNNNDDVSFMFNIIAPDCPGSSNAQISIGGVPGGPDLTCVWADPNITVSNCVASNLEAGSYDVNIMDENGCNRDTTFLVMDPILFEAEIIDSTGTSCNDGTDGAAEVIITSNPQSIPDFIFLWNGIQGEMIQDDLPAGPNTLTIVGNNCNIDLEFSIPNPSIITLDNRDEMIITQCADECTGSVTLLASGGTSNNGDFTFNWLDGTPGPTRDDLCPGVHQVMIEDDNGCVILDSVTVMNRAALNFNIVDVRNVGCSSGQGGSIEVNANGGCGNFTFEWTDNVSSTNLAEDLIQGDYSITVTDSCGCTQVIDTMVLGETPIFAELDLGFEGACPGDLVCVGIDPSTITGGSGSGYTFTIDSGTLGERVPIDSCLMILPGPHTVDVFDDSTPPCTFSFGLVDIPGPSPLSIDIGPDEINTSIGEEPLELAAAITSETDIIGVAWTPEEAICVDSFFCDQVTLNPTRSTIITAIVTDENGCTAADQILLSVDAVRRVFLPNTFMPESSEDNRFMILTGPGVEEIQDFLIYDRYGNLVFELPEEAKPFPHSLEDGWDGRNGVRRYEQGVYAWIANIRFSDGEVITFNGGVTLIR